MSVKKEKRKVSKVIAKVSRTFMFEERKTSIKEDGKAFFIDVISILYSEE